jgi:hypothetical protein
MTDATKNISRRKTSADPLSNENQTTNSHLSSFHYISTTHSIEDTLLAASYR